MVKRLYFCDGCGQVQYDNDYSKEDGFLITDLDKLEQSILRCKKEREE